MTVRSAKLLLCVAVSVLSPKLFGYPVMCSVRYQVPDSGIKGLLGAPSVNFRRAQTCSFLANNVRRFCTIPAGSASCVVQLPAAPATSAALRADSVSFLDATSTAACRTTGATTPTRTVSFGCANGACGRRVGACCWLGSTIAYVNTTWICPPGT